MGTSKQKTDQTTASSSVSGPWGPASGPLAGAIPDIEANYNARKGQQFFPGQTYADFDPSQSQALHNIEDIASRGDSANEEALTFAKDTLGGKYLDAGNPHFGLMAARVRDEVLPSITAQWAKSGRGTGNLDVVDAASTGVGDSIGALAYQNYNDRMHDMISMAGMAPGLDAARYADADRLFSAGATRQGQAQRGIDESMARFDFANNRDAMALDEKLARLSGLAKLGGTSEGTSHTTGTQTTQQSPLQMVAGAGLTGLGLMGASPWSTASWLPWNWNKSTGGGGMGGGLMMGATGGP